MAVGFRARLSCSTHPNFDTKNSPVPRDCSDCKDVWQTVAAINYHLHEARNSIKEAQQILKEATDVKETTKASS